MFALFLYDSQNKSVLLLRKALLRKTELLILLLDKKNNVKIPVSRYFLFFKVAVILYQ